MNKQQLTKTFSFSKWLLFFFFAVGLSLSSCGEDYGDDIDDLRARLDKIPSYTELETKINTLQSDLAGAKKLATDAADAAKVSAIADADGKLATLKADLEAKIKALGNNGVTEEQIAKIVDEVKKSLDPLEAEIINLVGHRVTSLVRIPTQTLNDEPAIFFTTLSYVPQVFNPAPAQTAYTQNLVDSKGNGEVTKDNGKRLYIDNKTTIVEYQVSPASSIKASNIIAPYFMGNIQTNYDLKSVYADQAGKDLPIKVAKWELNETTGVLRVYAEKSVPADQNINFEGRGTDVQKYYIASLRTIIPEADRTSEEVASKKEPVVASEFSRLAEQTVVPMIKQRYRNDSGIFVDAGAHTNHNQSANRAELLNGKNDAGKYVHYHDSVSLYQSSEGQLIDHTVTWNEDVDLIKYVNVGEFEKLFIDGNGVVSTQPGSHATIEDYKAYGLEFRFSIPKTPYLLFANETDQQQFAKIDSKGIMTSKVYDINDKARTAIGRQPIVRIQLIDTRNNNNLVAQRYMKFIWTEDKAKNIEVTFPQDTVSCMRGVSTIFTKQMNEDFYYKLDDTYGFTKEQFHSNYKETEIISLLKDGVEILKNPPLTWRTLDDTYNSNAGITVVQANDYAMSTPLNATPNVSKNEDVIFAMAKDAGTNSATYHLKWYMSTKAIGTIKDFKKSDYVLTVKFHGNDGTDLIVKFNESIIVPPQTFAYQGPFWQPNLAGKQFNVNPSVYRTVDDYQLQAPNFANGAWTGWNTGKSNYNHIGADLMNGYLNPITNKIPANLDEFIAYIRSCADVRFEFNDKLFGNYPHLSGYIVTNERQALWSANELPLTDAQLQTYSHPDVRNGRYDKLAATIWNRLGATALENKKTDAKNKPWKYDETLGTGVDQASSQLWFSEINPSDGSTAAQDLVGKKVPMQLIVEYNEYNNVPVQDFELYIWDPMTVSKNKLGNFQDAVADGSPINVQNNLSYTDWNKYFVSRALLTPPAGTTDEETIKKYTYSQIMWDFYQVRNVKYLTDEAKTNLKLIGNVYTPTAGVTNGNLPTNRSIEQSIKSTTNSNVYVPVPQDPTHLVYYNNSGTPVNISYEIYMPIQVLYKWGVNKETVTITVNDVKPTDPTVVTKKK